MKVDVKHANDTGTWDGSSISIETGKDLCIAPGTKYVGIQTNNAPEWVSEDELWIFKRKAFLKAVAKALNVIIYERDAVAELDGGPEPGYYR